MINEQLLNPRSIVIIGGSNNVHKPGGSIVRNIINGGFGGDLHIVNPKEDEVQGIKAFHDVKDIPQTDLAVLVVAAKFCPDYVDYLCAEKGVRAFVISLRDSVRRRRLAQCSSNVSSTPARNTVPP